MGIPKATLQIDGDTGRTRWKANRRRVMVRGFPCLKRERWSLGLLWIVRPGQPPRRGIEFSQPQLAFLN